MKPAVLISPRDWNKELLAALAARGKVELISWASEDFSAGFLREQGAANFDSLLDQAELQKKIAQALQAQGERVLSCLRQVDYAGRLARKFHCSPEKAAQIAAGTENTLRRSLPAALYYIFGLEQLLRKVPLNLLVLHSMSTWSWRTLAAAARARGVKVLHLPHGCGWGIFGLHGVNTLNLDHDHFDMAVVASELEKMAYRAYGVPEAKMALTGHPKLDAYTAFAQGFRADYARSRSEFWGRLGFAPKGKVILYCTQWVNSSQVISLAPDKMDKYFLRVLEGYARAKQESAEALELVVKFHPGIAKMQGGSQPVIEHYQKLAQAQGAKDVFFLFSPDNKLGIKEIVSSSDLLICAFSTMLSEAYLLGTRVICLEDLPQAFAGMSWHAQVPCALDSDELARRLGQALASSGPLSGRDNLAYQKGVRELTYSWDGRAMARIVDLVEEMAGVEGLRAQGAL